MELYTCFAKNTTIAEPVIDGYECPKHFFCPNSTASVPESVPQVCPPTVDCSLKRAKYEACQPQGQFEPIV